MVISFVVFLLLFLVVGVLSMLKRKKDNVDYLLAGQTVPPSLVAISAIATNNSGYMFIGMIGYTYMVRLSSIWLLVGWIFGDFLASLFIHKRLRLTTEKCNALSFAEVLSRWHGQDYRILQIVAGLITVIFLGTYAAAQLNAGSKALYVLFGWNYASGAIIGALIVVLYCFSGGIRASIWTDAAQSVVMIFSMVTLLWVSVNKLGGFTPFYHALENISPTYMNLLPSDLPLGPIAGAILFIVGWIGAGFGVVGQPHIMVRFMAMKSPQNMTRIRLYYYGWYIAFYIVTIAVGLCTRLLLPEIDAFDEETALPLLAQNLLPEVFVGLVLAGLFAAVMSTADSQILSCSAALTHDFSRSHKQNYNMTKFATLFVTSIALMIALYGPQSVFTLVLIAWSALASAFAPLLTVYALGGKPSQPLALIMMTTGLISMLLWRTFGNSDSFYEVAPGILGGLIPYVTTYIYKKVIP